MLWHPTTAQLAEALRFPARPLFLGRKPCLPSMPLLRDIVDGRDVLDVLRRVPSLVRPYGVQDEQLEACWPSQLGEVSESRQHEVNDRRDWQNQTHIGSRTRTEGLVRVVS